MARSAKLGRVAVDTAIQTAVREGREITVQDPTLPGFGVRVKPSGTATYFHRYQRNGKRDRVSIGRHGVWTPAKAYERARALAQMVDDGLDPRAERQRAARAPTIAKLCEEYMEGHAKLHKLSYKKDQQRIDKYIEPAVGRVLVHDLTRDRIRDLLSDIGVEQGKRGTANRVRALLSKMMSFAIELRYRADNPCAGLGKSIEKGGAAFPTPDVHRYLTPDEVQALFVALAGLRDRIAAAAIKWILLTGCRHQEALNLRWSDVDALRGRVLLMTTKTGQQRAVSPQALALLEGLPRPEGLNAPVFPSPRNPAKKRASLDYHWHKALDAANVGDVRIHDLRHTAASFAAANGASLSQIGAMLGHRSAQATFMYAKLVDPDVRAVASGVAVAIADAVAVPTKIAKLPTSSGGHEDATASERVEAPRSRTRRKARAR